MKLIVATRNLHKLEEIKAIWSDLPITLLSLAEFPQIIPVEEEGTTFEQNAEQKARQVASYLEGFIMAEDSGLEVDALGGSPGIFSARYAGPEATARENNQKLLNALRDVPWEERKARFVSVIALLDWERRVYFFKGVCQGIIATELSGINGFGYDPLFYIPEYGMTMAQLAPEIKNKISHRSRALEKARDTFFKL